MPREYDPAKRRERYLKHQEREKARRRRYYQDHKAEEQERSRSYYLENRDEIIRRVTENRKRRQDETGAQEAQVEAQVEAS